MKTTVLDRKTQMNIKNNVEKFAVVVPAAGVGKRMKSRCPKQYLKLAGETILEHTVNRLLDHSMIDKVIIALGDADEYIKDTSLFEHSNVELVIGGKERVDSVLAGLLAVDAISYPWVLVHDAARPCVSLADISKLVNRCIDKNSGGILAAPVRDTMKRTDGSNCIIKTEDRENLWHALTPQMYPTVQLINAIESSIESNDNITDESSAIELVGLASEIVEGSNENIKITHPDDLALAEFILNKQLKTERTQ